RWPDSTFTQTEKVRFSTMALVIEIESTAVSEKKGTSQRTQKDYKIREQQALMFKEGSRYPDKVKIVVPEGREHYPVGRYQLSDESFVPSRFGAIEVRPVLVPIAAAVKASA